MEPPDWHLHVGRFLQRGASQSTRSTAEREGWQPLVLKHSPLSSLGYKLARMKEACATATPPQSDMLKPPSGLAIGELHLPIQTAKPSEQNRCSEILHPVSRPPSKTCHPALSASHIHIPGQLAVLIPHSVVLCSVCSVCSGWEVRQVD